MKKKRIFTFILIGVFLTISPLFAEGKKEAEVLEVAVSFPGTVEFFKAQMKGMDKAAEDYGLKLTYADAEWDAGKQLAQVENFIVKGVDLILLCAADNEALIPSVSACNEADIPLITFTNVVGSSPDGKFEGVVSFIGTNEVGVGRLLGKMAELSLGDRKANIVMIEGTPGTPCQRMRAQGFREVVEKHPNWKIVYSQTVPGWTKEGSLAVMEAFLQTGEKVDLVSCQWHSAAVAARQALEEAGYKGKVYVTGYEFSKELIPYITEGKVDMTATYSVIDCGYKAVEAAAKYLKSEKIPRSIIIEPYIVDKSNVDEVEPEM
jgi:ABC-type sugar transport system substrate-binding protein